MSRLVVHAEPSDADLDVARAVLLWLHAKRVDDDSLRDEISHVRWALYEEMHHEVMAVSDGRHGPKAR